VRSENGALSQVHAVVQREGARVGDRGGKERSNGLQNVKPYSFGPRQTPRGAKKRRSNAKKENV